MVQKLAVSMKAARHTYKSNFIIVRSSVIITITDKTRMWVCMCVCVFSTEIALPFAELLNDIGDKQ